MITLRDDREQLFETLNHPTGVPTFFDRVADDVDWTVEGTNPVAGHYTDKKSLLAHTIGRLNSLTRDGTRLAASGRLVIDDDIVVVELVSTCTGLDGSAYGIGLCWVCRFDSAEPGATITEVREYVDSAAIARLVERNETQPGPGRSIGLF